MVRFPYSVVFWKNKWTKGILSSRMIWNMEDWVRFGLYNVPDSRVISWFGCFLVARVIHAWIGCAWRRDVIHSVNVYPQTTLNSIFFMCRQITPGDEAHLWRAGRVRRGGKTSGGREYLSGDFLFKKQWCPWGLGERAFTTPYPSLIIWHSNFYFLN